MKKIITITIALFVLFISVNSYADVVTKKYDYKDFHSVSVSSGMHLKVTQSDSYSISVKAEESDIKDLRVEKSGSKLEFYFKRSGWFNFGHHHRVEITVTMPELTGLGLSGGSVANITMNVSSKSFSADLSGGSYIEGNLTCGNIDFDLSGGSKVNLSGKGNNLKVDGSGGSIFRLKDFMVANVDAELSGGAQATVNMNGALDADQSGGSRIIYYGKMDLGHTSFSGGSGVSKGD